ncbi:MAG: Fur family ferric uptake transcriptional regulator [Crocinitomix sp.]|jgi:Fur family ferric uptake transcriptional regulator
MQQCCKLFLMKDLLADKKLSKTPFRKEVLAIFNKYQNAIPLSTVEKELKDYNRITLYRTIKIFLGKGIIHEITISGEESNYAICQDDCDTEAHQHQHIHFKCNSCSTIFCVEMDQFPTVALPGYQIDELEIQATGLCKGCNFL